MGDEMQRFMHGCLEVTVRGNIPMARPWFLDLIFGPRKKVHYVFGCSFEAYIVSCKVEAQLLNMFFPRHLS